MEIDPKIHVSRVVDSLRGWLHKGPPGDGQNYRARCPLCNNTLTIAVGFPGEKSNPMYMLRCWGECAHEAVMEWVERAVTTKPEPEPVPVPTVTTKGTYTRYQPHPRKYKTNAERQKAYRDRNR